MRIILGLGAIIAISVIAVIVVLILIFAIWWIATSNWFNKSKVKIDEARSGIDVALTKRYDLLTKSLATVKGYAKHEAETLEKVIEKRNGNISTLSMKEKSELNTKLDSVISRLNVVLENYPDLKASQNFMHLQLQISECEEQLQASRRIYNSNVSIFNQKRVIFPSSIVANAKHLNAEEFFEAEDYKKQDVKIEF